MSVSGHNKIFEGNDFTREPLPGLEFDGCDFINCNFYRADLSSVKFLECRFSGCDLSLAKLGGTLMSDVRFTRCKMLGLQLHECNQLGFTPLFDECILNNSSFFRVKMKGVVFRKDSFREADFTDADLSRSTFTDCDFRDALFDDTNLEKADLTTAFGYSLDPEKNRIKKATFSLGGLSGLLTKWNIKIEGSPGDE